MVGREESSLTWLDELAELGLAVVLVVLVQAFIGLVSHYTSRGAERVSSRSVLRVFHIVAGVVGSPTSAGFQRVLTEPFR